MHVVFSALVFSQDTASPNYRLAWKSIKVYLDKLCLLIWITNGISFQRSLLPFLWRAQFSSITVPEYWISKIFEKYHVALHFVGNIILIQKNLVVKWECHCGKIRWKQITALLVIVNLTLITSIYDKNSSVL